MEKIKIIFLGTGNAIPTEKRNHTAIFLNYKSNNILFDCGEGTQRQMRAAKISPAKINKIFFTHFHSDHFLGFLGLIETLAISEYNKTLEVYGPRGVKEFVQNVEKLLKKIKIDIKVTEIKKEKVYENEEIIIKSYNLKHNTPALAYKFEIKDKLRIKKEKIDSLKLPNSPLMQELLDGKDITINGKKIKSKNITYKEKGKKVSIILDTKYFVGLKKIAKDSDLLITESSFSNLEKELAEKYLHLTAEQAGKIAKDSKSKKLILTHISQRHEYNTKTIEEEAKKHFKNTFIAKELEIFEI